MAPKPPSTMHANPAIAAARSRRSFEKLNSLKISTDPTIMARPKMTIETFITTCRGEQMLEWVEAGRIAEVADHVGDEAVLRPEDPGDQHLSCEIPGTQHYDGRTHPVVAISEKPDPPYRPVPLLG